MRPSPAAAWNWVVIGGRGAVGLALVEKLRTMGVDAYVIDRTSSDGDTGEPIDVIAPDTAAQAALAAADVVVCALPGDTTRAALPVLDRLLRPSALLVDTTSAKTELVRDYEDFGFGQIVSINPMFRPDASFTGRPVCSITVRPGAKVEQFHRVLAGWGLRIVETTVEDHEKLTATTQAAVHASVLAWGLVLRSSGLCAEAVVTVATPPALTMLTLLARLCDLQPHVIHEVQTASEPAGASRRELVRALTDLECALEGSEESMDDVLDELRAWLGAENDQLLQLCAQQFDNLVMDRR